MSRVSGWVAHVVEYLQTNRLIRPKALYIGKTGLQYVPVDSRTEKLEAKT